MAKKEKVKIEASSGNVFKDIGFNDIESALIERRLSVLKEITAVVKRRKLKARDLERLFDEQQPRISDLLNEKISKFSLEKLLEYLERLGGDISIKVRFHKRAVNE